jgi:hypothetical protein
MPVMKKIGGDPLKGAVELYKDCSVTYIPISHFSFHGSNIRPKILLQHPHLQAGKNV